MKDNSKYLNEIYSSQGCHCFKQKSQHDLSKNELSYIKIAWVYVIIFLNIKKYCLLAYWYQNILLSSKKYNFKRNKKLN